MARRGHGPRPFEREDRSADDRPLLSIAIPTFNRADRLRVALEALLPQVQRLEGAVEVIVSDNASEDDTRAVVDGFRESYGVGYARNASNLGPIRNTVRLATELASGRYLWVLGDDDLVDPTAVERVVSAIEAHPELEVWYLNFRIARYPDDWPEHALGGFAGGSAAAANRDLEQRVLPRWQDVVRPESAMATQLYVHVVPTRVWRDYWCDRPIGEPYSEARWTWPHTYMIAETMSGKRCVYVGDPVLTIFDGGEAWSEHLSAVILLRTSELLEFYAKMGVLEHRICLYREKILRAAKPHLIEIMRRTGAGNRNMCRSFIANEWRHLEAWRSYLGAIADGKPRSPIGSALRLARRAKRAFRYLRASDTTGR